MGFFDRFKKRVQEVADETDLDALTAEEGTQEAEEAITSSLSLSVEEEWDDLTEIEEPVKESTDDDDWDDWDEEPEPQPSTTLSKKERKLAE